MEEQKQGRAKPIEKNTADNTHMREHLKHTLHIYQTHIKRTSTTRQQHENSIRSPQKKTKQAQQAQQTHTHTHMVEQTQGIEQTCSKATW